MLLIGSISELADTLRLAEWAGFYTYVEVGLWPSMGVAMLFLALRRRGVVRRDCLIAAVTLVVFGASDWFEAQNNNEWWHPWWLLLWKVTCGAILFLLVGRAVVRGKRERNTPLKSVQ